MLIVKISNLDAVEILSICAVLYFSIMLYKFVVQVNVDSCIWKICSLKIWIIYAVQAIFSRLSRTFSGMHVFLGACVNQAYIDLLEELHIHTEKAFVCRKHILMSLILELFTTQFPLLRTLGKKLLKTLWEKEKMLVTSIFFFSHNVF